MGVRGLLNAVDGGDVRVAQGGQDFCFSFKAGDAILIPGKGLRQYLDRHVTVELGIGGTIDFAHATLTDFGGDLVMGNGGVDHGGECNGLSGCCQPQASFKPESPQPA